MAKENDMKAQDWWNLGFFVEISIIAVFVLFNWFRVSGAYSNETRQDTRITRIESYLSEDELKQDNYDLPSTISLLKGDIKELWGQVDAIPLELKPFDEDSWKREYEKTEQYVKDCFTWQKKHPELVKKTALTTCENGLCVTCDSGQQNGVLCTYNMRKKATDGNIYDVWCTEQKDATDFIP